MVCGDEVADVVMRGVSWAVWFLCGGWESYVVVCLCTIFAQEMLRRLYHVQLHFDLLLSVKVT